MVDAAGAHVSNGEDSIGFYRDGTFVETSTAREPPFGDYAGTYLHEFSLPANCPAGTNDDVAIQFYDAAKQRLYSVLPPSEFTPSDGGFFPPSIGGTITEPLVLTLVAEVCTQPGADSSSLGTAPQSSKACSRTWRGSRARSSS